MNPRNAAAPVIFRRSAKPNGYGGWTWKRGELVLKVWRGDRGSFTGSAEFKDARLFKLATMHGSAQLAADALVGELVELGGALLGIGDLFTKVFDNASRHGVRPAAWQKPRKAVG